MSPPNGHTNGSGIRPIDTKESPLSDAAMGTSSSLQFTSQQIQELVAEMEVPFDSGVIEWRVTNTSKINETIRGQVIPYADQRAYTDRLNRLFTPAGWTRRYTVHTSANFQRGEDQKIVAKVFVTCELTIFGFGLHSATGEEWADDPNAGTSAEAQAFKRACSCFGLGRYLYYFTGVWVDLDDKRRLKTKPALAGWATPQGWRQGLRPDRSPVRNSSRNRELEAADQNGDGKSTGAGERAALVRQIEAMAEPLGKRLYRGLLKTIARVWIPDQIHDDSLLRRVLLHMQSAQRGLSRLEAALEKTGPEPLARILRSMDLKALDRVDNLQTLRQIVVRLEAEATNSDQF